MTTGSKLTFVREDGFPRRWSAIRRIGGERAHLIEFEDGIRIERTVDAMARSAHEGRWVEVPA